MRPSDPLQCQPWVGRDVWTLLLLLLLALTLRCVLFAGFGGSDEVTYLGSALGILSGEWPSSSYVGSLRYGVSIPMALSLGAFGVSEGVAVLWGLLSSVAEVGLVFVATRRLWGWRVATLAGLLLAVAPLHSHTATRMLADAPLAMTISLTFLLILVAERTGKPWQYLLAGLSLGLSYWVKDAGFVVAVLSLGTYVLLYRRWHGGWLWLAAAAAIIVFANMALMQVVNGEWLHLYAVGKTSMARIAMVEATSPTIYLKYLLLDLRHVAMLGPGALVGLVLLRRQWASLAGYEVGLYLVWLLAFILILSALPLRQPNYISLLLAPLAIFSACAVSRLHGIRFVSVSAFMVAVSLLLATLQQQSLHAFTANSRATVDLADMHPEARVYAGTGGYRADQFATMLGRRQVLRPDVQGLAELELAAHGGELYVVADPQTRGWGDPVDEKWQHWVRPDCLGTSHVLPAAALGHGRLVADALIDSVERLGLGALAAQLTTMLRPRPALVYKIEAGCLISKQPERPDA